MTEQSTAWTPPDPRALPGLRDELIEYLHSSLMHDQTAQALVHGLGTLSPRTGDPARDASELLADERSRLASAELYYVTDDMTRLALVAAESLPVHSLRAEDLPAESGFMVFSEPIASYAPTAVRGVVELVYIVAVSWGPSTMMQPGSGVWMTFWADTDTEGSARTLQHESGMSYSKAYEVVRQSTSTLSWDNELLVHYGTNHIVTVTEDSSYAALRGTVAPIDPDQGWEQIRGTAAWAQITRAAWLLITQPGVTEVDDQPQSRAMRRRAERHGYPASPVRVVRVRDRANAPERAGGETDERTYHVRWTVRGHWRNQWYPSRGEHRPVWINPHVKGPQEAPLHTGETVHLLDQ